MQQNISLKPYNTFGVEAKTKFFAEIHSVEELIQTLKLSNSQTLKFSDSANFLGSVALF